MANSIRKLDKNFAKLYPHSVWANIGGPGCGKSTFLIETLNNLSTNPLIKLTERPRQLVFSPGAASEIMINQEKVNAFFDYIREENNIEDKLEEIRSTLSNFKFTCLVLEDFTPLKQQVTQSLCKLMFHHLRHSNLSIILNMQSIVNLKDFNNLLGHIHFIQVYASLANITAITRLCQKFNYSKYIKDQLLSELRRMVYNKESKGVYDAMLILPRLSLTIFNVLTKPIGVDNKLSKLNLILDCLHQSQLMADGSGFYFLIPQNKLQTFEPKQQKENSSDLMHMFPSHKREEAQFILKLLRENGLEKNMNMKTMMFVFNEYHCSIVDLIAVIVGLAQKCPQDVSNVLKLLEKKGIGIPHVLRSPLLKSETKKYDKIDVEEKDVYNFVE